MESFRKRIEAQWVNDHLDLLLHAWVSGDKEWEKAILAKLSDKNDEIEKQILSIEEDALWSQINTAGNSLLSLYEKFKGNPKLRNDQNVKYEIMRLKQQKAEAMRLLRLLNLRKS